MNIAKDDMRLRTVPLNWKEVYYINCPAVTPSSDARRLSNLPASSLHVHSR
jgi:hypothetical protein